jgi:hypothetical protein
MGKIAPKEVVERQRYKTPDDLSIPNFLPRPFIPVTATLLPELPARSSRREVKRSGCQSQSAARFKGMKVAALAALNVLVVLPAEAGQRHRTNVSPKVTCDNDGRLGVDRRFRTITAAPAAGDSCCCILDRPHS